MNCPKCGRFCRKMYSSIFIRWHCYHCRVTYSDIRALEAVDVGKQG